jgi:hypothetical protein
VDPKMIFAKNQEVKFLALKCKTTPVPRNRQELAQNLEYTSKGCHNETRVDTRIPGGKNLFSCLNFFPHVGHIK